MTIAHRAGNSLEMLEEAFAAGVDYAEADVWLYRGRLEARHEKTLGPLPILWDRWSLTLGWAPRLSLERLLEATAGRGRLLLDLKGRARDLAEAVAEAIGRAEATESVAFTGQWHHLDRVGALLPGAPRFYTIGRPGRLDLLRPRLERGEIEGVSIDSRFLTEETVAQLRRWGVRAIITWAVSPPERARQMLSWGVSGITSDDLSLLAAVRDGRLGESG